MRGINYDDISFLQEFDAFRASKIAVAFEYSQIAAYVVFQDIFDVEQVFASVSVKVFE